MMISIWTGEVKPGMVDDANREIASFIEVLRHTSGLRKFASGVDRSTNEVVAVAIWESGEAASALRASPEFVDGMGRLMPYLSKPLELHRFEGLAEV